MKRDEGFTLIELLIVVTVMATIMVLAVPSLLGARVAANESAAIANLHTMHLVQEQYHTRFGSYAGQLGDLQASSYIGGFSGTTVLSKGGYDYSYSAAAGTYSINADPEVAGTTGFRHFYTSPTGVIRFSLSGPAGTTSPAVD